MTLRSTKVTLSLWPIKNWFRWDKKIAVTNNEHNDIVTGVHNIFGPIDIYTVKLYYGKERIGSGVTKLKDIR